MRQVPGLNQDVFNAMKEEASKRNIPATGYHGFVVFDEVSIQVGCCWLLLQYRHLHIVIFNNCQEFSRILHILIEKF